MGWYIGSKGQPQCVIGQRHKNRKPHLISRSRDRKLICRLQKLDENVSGRFDELEEGKCLLTILLGCDTIYEDHTVLKGST